VKDDLGDLYINGKCLGYEVSAQMIKWDGVEGVAFLADCDAVSGVLTVFDGKKASSLRGDVAAFAYTAKGEIVFLCDVGQNSGQGDICRMVDGNAVVVADGVTHLIIPIQ